jgi:hypothetical protein
VLEYLCRDGKPKKPLIEPATALKSAWHTGSHPDIVDYLWESVAQRLPAECRAVICGTPALVAPVSGVIFAAALGTEYGMRLPPAQFGLARAAGAELVHEYRTVKVRLDLPQTFGMGWVFGLFDRREPEWCVAALKYAEE